LPRVPKAAERIAEAALCRAVGLGMVGAVQSVQFTFEAFQQDGDPIGYIINVGHGRLTRFGWREQTHT
jgi:hypothetical protein